MYYTDSHIHLQDYTSSEVKNVVTNALKNNVRCFVNVSSSPDDWQSVIKMSKRFSGIIPAIGIHPWHAEKADEAKFKILEKYLQKYPDLWLGECGIDRIKNPDTKVQSEVFSRQIELANKYARPLIIHAVKAENEMYQFLPLLPKRTIFHSFGGSAEWGQKIQSFGFYLGLNFSFFKKDDAAEILPKLDLHKILLETDAPYQPNKGYVRNQPENLPVLVAAIGAIYGLSEIKIAAILTENWRNFNNSEKE